MYANLGNYIPAGGALTVRMPSEVAITSNPFPDFSSSDSSLVKSGTYDSTSVTFTAASQIPAGEITVTFGGIRNPKSF